MDKNSITQRFPYFFKMESGDEEWYESKGIIDITELDEVSKELLAAATVYAKEVLVEPDENEFTACTCDFMFGATWYFTNIHILKKLPNKQAENAIIIAQIKYSKQDCENVFPDEDWTLAETYNFISESKSFFLDGVQWALNKNISE